MIDESFGVCGWRISDVILSLFISENRWDYLVVLRDGSEAVGGGGTPFLSRSSM